eukprot:618510-Amphidinium_carterae.1
MHGALCWVWCGGCGAGGGVEAVVGALHVHSQLGEGTERLLVAGSHGWTWVLQSWPVLVSHFAVAIVVGVQLGLTHA